MKINNINNANNTPFTLFDGVNVLESKQFAIDICGYYVGVCKKLDIPFIFKGSFDKANRSSIHSYRGPGWDKGLEILQAVKDQFKVSVITDVYEIWQSEPVAKVADVL